MSDLIQVEKDIIKNLKGRQKFKEKMDIVAIILVLSDLNKREEFLQYLQEYPEQDFDELTQVAFAYIEEEDD